MSQIVNIVAIIVHCLEINNLQIELEACDFKLEEYRDVQQIASVFIKRLSIIMQIFAT